ncbi:Lrp/AsnC family transcriptional regulator [Candidatus Bathyarchaeota archaeon]|nr:MAG: Lrp/AsnC family transcriptional regulator [Candidatus Bathyarchaeota archaeon]
MITSYTLARVLPASDKEVYMKVKAFDEVKDVILTYGEYDLILRIESNSLEDLDHFIFNKLRAIDGITTTTTLLEARPKSFTKDG